MPAFTALAGMPYWIDVRSSDTRTSRYFYSKLLGWEISDDDYGVARKSGLPVAGILPNEANHPDTWVTYFLADDIEQSLRDVATAGGRAFSDPVDGALGRMAVAADPAGGLFGLIEPLGEEAFVAAGEPGTVVWHDYCSTSAFDEVLEFYQKLFGWDLARTGGFATALQDAAAFAGLRDVSEAFGPEVPSFWQSFIGVDDVRAASRRAEELGGEIIRAPFEAEFGLLAIIADSTGATVTLCEVDEAVGEDELRESDDLFNL